MKTHHKTNNPAAAASHGKSCDGVHTATKASAWRFLKPNTHIRAMLIFAVAAAGFILSGQDAYAQARLTSPSTNEALPTPTFKLRWDKVGQTETFLYLGSQQGLNDYFGKSMGTSSGVDLTWSNPPPTVWVRLWSLMPIYTGVAGSTPAYYQWQGRDYFFKVGVKVLSNVLIDAWMIRLQADNGTLGGQCKAYLQLSFASAVAQTGVKNPSGVAPFMPRTLSGGAA